MPTQRYADYFLKLKKVMKQARRSKRLYDHRGSVVSTLSFYVLILIGSCRRVNMIFNTQNGPGLRSKRAIDCFPRACLKNQNELPKS